MNHAEKAAAFIQDDQRTDWHNRALWFVRRKRDSAANTVSCWEQLREKAEEIKQYTLAHLDEFLEEFENRARALGASVHWAKDSQEHNQIVLGILNRHQAQNLVKSKSMLTEECGLNPFLEKHGISVIDTDLGERIVQLRREPPSHIVLPAIHLKREQVGQLFHQTLGSEAGVSDPTRLTEIARSHLREKFLNADAGLTGVNFGIAETGGIVVCTNEGNADLGTALPPVHIACMGIEKLIPRLQDLSIFLRLLARSATGQHLTTYTSHYHGPAEGKELHIVLVDNGRSRLLAHPELRRSLYCIRCGACLNTCPVYRRSGGHSYGYTIPGPIGSILAPTTDLKKHYSLPFASTLCGSCRDICPVKVEPDKQLLFWRQEIVRNKMYPAKRRIALWIMGKILGSAVWFRVLGRLARFCTKRLPRSILYNPLNTWGRQRELPAPPSKSFSEWYKENRNHQP